MKLIFLCVLASIAANAVEVTPVQKVLSLLQGMLEKGKKEKHQEQVMFAASRQFCDDNKVKKKADIKEEMQKIQGLTALIAKDSADISHLLKLIKVLDEDQDVWSGDIKAATKVRAIEKADYDKTHQDYSESIDAMQRAINVLKKETHDRKQKKGKGSFAQISALNEMTFIPSSAKKTINAFLQQGEEGSMDELGMDMGAPEANGYEFQSQGVIDMLDKLVDKFVDERASLEKEEANGKNAYQLLMQNLKAEIVQAIKDKHGKQLNKAKTAQMKADEKGDQKEEQAIKKVDAKFLADLRSTCSMKAGDFQARQQLRAEEIEAIEKAIEIIGGGSVSGHAKKHLPGLLQKGSSFGQLRSNMNTEMQNKVAQYLKRQAAKLNSRVLSKVAERVAANPFAKVKKMIKDLVVRLMEEANEEAEHKGWCDTELTTNGQTRKEKTDAVETLNAEIDLLKASIAKLTDSIGDLTEQVASLDKAMAKSTKLRSEEKKTNTETISDSQEAQTAVAQALTVLKEFYAKAAEATAFVQKPYQGMQAENGGVVGMLEVIESDFARLESETKASEATAQKEYDSFMTDSKVDKAEKSTAADHRAAKRQGEMAKLTTSKNDLVGTQKELDAALAYFDKLRPSCVDSGVSYEDRVNRRKEEIESLQEALKVMNGEDIA
jgi:hypothetical protein